jgi:translation elongation factor EF-1beta
MPDLEQVTTLKIEPEPAPVPIEEFKEEVKSLLKQHQSQARRQEASVK